MKEIAIIKENLDVMVNEEETLREFIRNTENEFDLVEEDLESMSDEEFEEYVEFLDDLWNK